MPTISVWKFVDRPEAAPTVLLDMNDGDTWSVKREGFDISPPPLRRSVVSNNLMDGGTVTSTNYDLRELRFSLILSAATEDGRNAQLKSLEAELAKPANLIMFQHKDSSFPVFFRTLRSDNPVYNREWAPSAWQVDCSVLAEPYAIGTRHDIVTGATVNNDPAAAANPTRLDITGVRGDSPAPALAQFSVAGGFNAGSTFTLAQRSHGDPTALTLFAQAEAGALGTDTTVQPNDADMSGAGSNFVRCTFATDNNLTTRLTVTVPTATVASELRGRYRVYVRLRRTGTTSAFNMRCRVGGTNPTNGPLTLWATNMPNPLWMLDLGTVDLPAAGAVPPAIGYGGQPAGFTPLTLEIQAQRTSGTSNLDIDYIYLFPADEAQCSVRQTASVGSLVIDGPNDTVYGMAAGSSPTDPVNRTIDNGGGLMPRQGGLPMLVPGTTNRWLIVRPDQFKTATSTWSVSYWPRWREVATS